MPEFHPYNLPSEFKPELLNYYQLACEEEARGEEVMTEDLDSPIFSEIKADDQHYTDKHIHSMGGMKLICRVNDLRTGRPIAMAEMKKQGKCSPEEVEQFLREARITAALEHPNIVPIYDIGLNKQGKPFFTMKFMKDDSLKKVIRELVKANPFYTQKYTLNILLDIFLKVCDAVAFAHSCRVVHLDIKPGNVMIGQYGEVYICDWGLSKLLDSSREKYAGIAPLDETIMNEITLFGVVKGTPGFMAPEQINSKFGAKNEQTDIYALGALLYTMLVLKRPYSGMDVKQTLEATQRGTLMPPKDVGIREVPESLTAICMKAMARNQKDRYKSVDDMIADIRSYQEGFATEAENATPLKALKLYLKRNKLLISMILFLLVPAMVAIPVFINILEDREIEFDSTLQAQNSKIDDLKQNELQFKNSLADMRNKYIKLLIESSFAMRKPLIVNTVDTQTQVLTSSKVALSDNPKGTDGKGLHLRSNEVLYTGLVLPNAFTIAFWVKTPSILQNEFLKVKTDGGGGGEVDLWIDGNGVISFYTFWGDYPVRNAIRAQAGVIKPDTWHHIAISHKGEVIPKVDQKDWMDLCVDGISVAQSNTANFGGSPWGNLTVQGLDCTIDELRVWNKALNVASIASEKDNLSPDSANMLGWFKFNDKSINVRNAAIKEEASERFSSQRVALANNPKGTAGNGLNLLAADTFSTGVNLPATFTISFWAKVPENLKNYSMKITTDKHDSHFKFHINAKGSIQFSTYPDEINTIKTGAGTAKPGKWTHFALVHMGPGSGMELYLNGALAGKTPTNFIVKSWGKLKLDNFGCVIDELRIWRGPLDAFTLTVDKDKLSPLKTGLIGWYKFDEKSGNAFRDSSGNNNDVIVQ